MSSEEPSSPAQARQKALDALARLEINDRIASRQSRRMSRHSLLTVLLPLWLWALGLAFLPDATPMFAKAMFHASCWGGFAWLAYDAWRHARETSPTRLAQEKRILEEDIERAQRRRKIRDS